MKNSNLLIFLVFSLFSSFSIGQVDVDNCCRQRNLINQGGSFYNQEIKPGDNRIIVLDMETEALRVMIRKDGTVGSANVKFYVNGVEQKKSGTTFDFSKTTEGATRVRHFQKVLEKKVKIVITNISKTDPLTFSCETTNLSSNLIENYKDASGTMKAGDVKELFVRSTCIYGIYRSVELEIKKTQGVGRMSFAIYQLNHNKEWILMNNINPNVQTVLGTADSIVKFDHYFDGRPKKIVLKAISGSAAFDYSVKLPWFDL